MSQQDEADLLLVLFQPLQWAESISTMSQADEHGKSQWSASGNCCDEQCTFAAQCAVFSAHWHKGDALKSGAALEAHGNPIGCMAAESAG